MKEPRAKLPIGIFDSGIGGISVLAEIIKALPCEEYVYFADTLNSPYGIKPENIVRSLSLEAAAYLSGMGIKCLVVACNTATGVAINEIRKMCAFPVIGMEPAVKPAVQMGLKGKILIMATPLTIKSRKFNELVQHYKHLSEIVPVPCEGLVEIIEGGCDGGDEIRGYLSSLFSGTNKADISAIVLGCTHYVLIKREIIANVGGEINIMDGNSGTARRLKTVLQSECLLNDALEKDFHPPLKAKVRFYVSGNGSEAVKRYKQLLQKEGIDCN